MTIGAGGLKLEGDTVLPQPVLLTGTMVIHGSVSLPSAISMDDTDTVEVLIDGCVQETYTPSTVLKHGTVLPWATLLPSGITLNAGTVIPGGATLPAGTILMPNTSLPRSTMVPAGFWLPGGTRIPSHIAKRLVVHKMEDEIVETSAQDDDSLGDLVNSFRKV